MKVYEIDFEIGLTTHVGKARFTKPYFGVLVLAADMNEVINGWPRELLKTYPFREGSGGSHYSEDPVYGDKLIFVKIEEKLSGIKLMLD